MGVRIQTAMVIDDDDDFVELLTAILESRKIYVLSISNLEEAEQNLNFLKPTVIFLDNNFPEGLGVNFIRQIKDFDEDIRIVMMTADSSTWIREKAIEEGIDYFLRKPFTTKAVYSVLDKLNFRKVSMQ
jgi:two-component system alkaline phosphatase synthesis response regulator PhoP